MFFELNGQLRSVLITDTEAVKVNMECLGGGGVRGSDKREQIQVYYTESETTGTNK